MHHKKTVATNRHRIDKTSSILGVIHHSLDLIPEKDINKISIDCPKDIPIKYFISLDVAIRALIANAIDAHDDIVKIKVIQTDNHKAIIEISNKGQIKWDLLRKQAREEAKNGNLYLLENNYYVACSLNLFLEHISDKTPVTEAQVDRIPDKELLFIRHLTTKKKGKTIGGRGIGLALTKSVLDEGKATLEISSINNQTTARVTLN